MKPYFTLTKATILLLLMLSFTTSLAALPTDSVYQLNAVLIDQEGRASQWADTPKELSKGPRIVSMFYSHCDYACPILLESIKQIEASLSPQQRRHLSVGLVSLDPERDTPEQLKKVATQHHVDQTRWRLYRATPAEVKKIAALLGVQYRQLSSGEFNHSSVLILLDAEGHELARTEKINPISPIFMQAVHKAVATF